MIADLFDAEDGRRLIGKEIAYDRVRCERRDDANAENRL